MGLAGFFVRRWHVWSANLWCSRCRRGVFWGHRNFRCIGWWSGGCKRRVGFEGGWGRRFQDGRFWWRSTHFLSHSLHSHLDIFRHTGFDTTISHPHMKCTCHFNMGHISSTWWQFLADTVSCIFWLSFFHRPWVYYSWIGWHSSWGTHSWLAQSMSGMWNHIFCTLLKWCHWPVFWSECSCHIRIWACLFRTFVWSDLWPKIHLDIFNASYRIPTLIWCSSVSAKLWGCCIRCPSVAVFSLNRTS